MRKVENVRMVLNQVLTVAHAFVREPLRWVFRHGPCMSRYVPMHCGMSESQICTRLVERVGESVWSKIPGDCEDLIEAEFQSWYTLVLFCGYCYIIVCLGHAMAAGAWYGAVSLYDWNHGIR